GILRRGLHREVLLRHAQLRNVRRVGRLEGIHQQPGQILRGGRREPDRLLVPGHAHGFRAVTGDQDGAGEVGRDAVDPGVVLLARGGQQAQRLDQLRRRLVQRTEALLAEYVVDGLGDPGPVVLGDPHVTDAERGMRRTGRDGLPQPVEPDQGQFDRVTDDAHFSPITGGTDFSSEPNSLFGSSVAWNLRLCSLSSPLPPAAPAPPIMPPIPMPPRMPPMPAPRAAAAAPPAPPGAPPPAKAPLARPPSAAEPLPEPLPKAPAPKPPAPVPEPAKSDGEKLDAEVLPSFGLDGVNELPASSSRARRARSAASCWRLRASSSIWRRCSSARRCASC